MEKYYKYNGSLKECEIQEILIKIISISEINSLYDVKLSDEFSKILSNDEYIEMKPFIKETLKNSISTHIVNKLVPVYMVGANVHYPLFPLIIPIINVNINIKAVTLSVLALLLDIDITKGFLSGFLALSGFNNKAFAKLNESAGEKCLLIEICSKEKSEADVHNFGYFCGKECVNNNLKCKYRAEGKCLMKIQEAIEKCNNLVERNVLKKNGDFYCYILI